MPKTTEWNCTSDDTPEKSLYFRRAEKGVRVTSACQRGAAD